MELLSAPVVRLLAAVACGACASAVRRRAVPRRQRRAVSAKGGGKHSGREKLSSGRTLGENVGKLAAIATHHVENVCERKRRNLCGRCWMRSCPPSCCICDRLPHPGIRLPHRVLVYIHYKEVSQQRSSNSAKLLWLGLENAERFVYGVPGDERRLRAELEAAGPRACVLFPSPESMTPGEFQAEAAAATRAAGGPACALQHLEEKGTVPLTLVVIDSTWPGAKSMERALPASVPRVRLADIQALKYPMMRKMPFRDRLTTMAAVMQLLEQVGGCDADALEGMDALMWLLIRAYFQQNPQNSNSPYKGENSQRNYASFQRPDFVPRPRRSKGEEQGEGQAQPDE